MLRAFVCPLCRTPTRAVDDHCKHMSRTRFRSRRSGAGLRPEQWLTGPNEVRRGWSRFTRSAVIALVAALLYCMLAANATVAGGRAHGLGMKWRHSMHMLPELLQNRI